MDLVVAGADLAFAVDHEAAIGEFAVAGPHRERAEMRPRCHGACRRLADRGEHRISSSCRRLLRRARASRSSRPVISGVNSISAPPAAALPIASASARHWLPGRSPWCDWKRAIRVMRQAASSRSSLPSRSSASRSSQPPTCCLADEDLRNRRPAIGALDHQLLHLAAPIHGDFLIFDTLLLEQRLGAPAKRAKALSVDLDNRHWALLCRHIYALCSTHQL